MDITMRDTGPATITAIPADAAGATLPAGALRSIQATGSSIFIVTGVCIKRQKGVNHYGDEQIGTH